MRMRTATAALLAALGLGACGSTTVVTVDSAHSVTAGGATSAGTSDTTVTTATATAGTPSTTSAGATTSAGSSTTATATTQTDTRRGQATTGGGTPACVATMLRLGFIGGQGAAGNSELAFSLTNIGSGSCHTYGYPGVQFQTSSGVALPTDSTRTTQDFFGSAPIGTLTIAPGQAVSFRLGTSDVSSSSSQCTSAARLQVIPPDDTHTLSLPLPHGGAYECGTTTVTPVQPGTSAYR